ncbi:hypothetical protein ABH926_004808 [Catenulispora sp. GP43]
MTVDEDTSEETVEEPAEEADHDLVMATARRIVASDAAIIHRLGTV